MHCFHCYKHQFNGPSSTTSTATKKKKNVQSYLNHSYSILWSLNPRVDACLGPAIYCISILTLVLISEAIFLLEHRQIQVIALHMPAADQLAG